MISGQDVCSPMRFLVVISFLALGLPWIGEATTVKGVVVEAVEPNSVAEKAGVVPDDR